MITSLQFDEAIKIISKYKSQVEDRIVEIKPKVIYVDIQNKIENRTFIALQYYYLDVLNIKLEWNDLKAMDLDTLKNIDFFKLRNYRSFGKIAQERLTNIIYSHANNSDSIIHSDD